MLLLNLKYLRYYFLSKPCRTKFRILNTLPNGVTHYNMPLSTTNIRIVLRSSSVHPPFKLRSSIEDRSKNDRRNIGESSEARRRCIETLMGNQGKGNPNKKAPKIPHKPHAPDFQKKTLKKLSTRKTLKINSLSKIAKKIFKKTS